MIFDYADPAFGEFVQASTNRAADQLRLTGTVRERFDFAGMDFTLLAFELKVASGGMVRTDGTLARLVRHYDGPERWTLLEDGPLTGTSSLYVNIKCQGSDDLRLSVGIAGEREPIIEADALDGLLYRITRPALLSDEPELVTRDDGFNLLADQIVASYTAAADTVEIVVPEDLSELDAP